MVAKTPRCSSNVTTSFGLIPSFSANSFTVEPSIRRADFSSPLGGRSSLPAMRSSRDRTFGGGIKSPLSNRPPLPSGLRPPRVVVRRERRRPESGGGIYVVGGVAVSPGVPNLSERGNEGRSLKRPVFRSTRSLGVIGGGGAVGTGARSPWRIPALRAAAVGRKTRTWREGIGADETTSGADSEEIASAAMEEDSISSTKTSSLGRTSGLASVIAGGSSARAAGLNFLTNLAVNGL